MAGLSSRLQLASTLQWSTLGCTAGISDVGFHVGLARRDQQPGLMAA